MYPPYMVQEFDMLCTIEVNRVSDTYLCIPSSLEEAWHLLKNKLLKIFGNSYSIEWHC